MGRRGGERRREEEGGGRRKKEGRRHTIKAVQLPLSKVANHIAIVQETKLKCSKNRGVWVNWTVHNIQS